MSEQADLGFGEDPRTGEPWFSHHGSNAPEGFWRKGEKRFGVSKDDPPRYRRHSLEELQQLGYARDDISHEAALDPLYIQAQWNIQERRDLGGKAVVTYEPPVTRHTIYGRMREAKQYAYYMRREDIREQLEAAGLTDEEVLDVLDTWDNEEDLRIESMRQGGTTEYSILDGTGRQIGRDFTEAELTRIAVEGTELEAEYLAHLEDQQEREAAAATYIAELQGQGLDPYALGHAWEDFVDGLDEVQNAIESQQVYTSLDPSIEMTDADIPF